MDIRSKTMKKLIFVLLLAGFIVANGIAFAQDEKAEPAEKKLTEEQLKNINDLFAQVEKSIAAKDYRNAIYPLNRISSIARGFEEQENKVAKLTEEIVKVAEEMLKKAKDNEDADPINSYKTYSELSRWRIKDIGTRASAAAQEFTKDPKKKEMLDLARSEETAKRMFDVTCKRQLEQKRYVEAYKSLVSITKNYPGTKTAEEVEAKLKEIMADKTIAAQIEEQRQSDIVKSMLLLADAFYRYGEKEEAIKYWKMICEKFPDCSRTEQAKARLERIANENK